jgi:hypothetical protein
MIDPRRAVVMYLAEESVHFMLTFMLSMDISKFIDASL